MNRKDDLAPQEIWEAQYRAEETCAAISCETDYDMPCHTRRCDPFNCQVIQFEAARLMAEHVPVVTALPKGPAPSWRHLIQTKAERLSVEQVGRASLMERECILHNSRRDGMFHLGNGCYRASKNYG